jgi:hypothetical protein
MSSPEVSFRDYLRKEVEIAEVRYEKDRSRVFALTGSTPLPPGPALLQAMAALSESMTDYLRALRRLAHYAANQSRTSSPKQMVAA